MRVGLRLYGVRASYTMFFSHPKWSTVQVAKTASDLAWVYMPDGTIVGVPDEAWNDHQRFNRERAREVIDSRPRCERIETSASGGLGPDRLDRGIDLAAPPVHYPCGVRAGDIAHTIGDNGTAQTTKPDQLEPRE